MPQHWISESYVHPPDPTVRHCSFERVSDGQQGRDGEGKRESNGVGRGEGYRWKKMGVTIACSPLLISCIDEDADVSFSLCSTAFFFFFFLLLLLLPSLLLSQSFFPSMHLPSSLSRSLSFPLSERAQQDTSMVWGRPGWELWDRVRERERSTSIDIPGVSEAVRERESRVIQEDAM